MRFRLVSGQVKERSKLEGVLKEAIQEVRAGKPVVVDCEFFQKVTQADWKAQRSER